MSVGDFTFMGQRWKSSEKGFYLCLFHEKEEGVSSTVLHTLMPDKI